MFMMCQLINVESQCSFIARCLVVPKKIESSKEIRKHEPYSCCSIFKYAISYFEKLLLRDFKIAKRNMQVLHIRRSSFCHRSCTHPQWFKFLSETRDINFLFFISPTSSEEYYSLFSLELVQGNILHQEDTREVLNICKFAGLYSIYSKDSQLHILGLYLKTLNCEMKLLNYLPRFHYGSFNRQG